MDDLTIYVKGMGPNEMKDVWDDQALISAYDSALKLAKDDVAKRVAMETNTVGIDKSKKGKEKSKKDASKSTPTKPIVWKEGMPCRAIYEEDGLEYEAFLMNFVGDDDCVVKFLGYENFETVPICSLKASAGNAARLRQLDEAAAAGALDEESLSESHDMDVYSEGPSSPEIHIPPRSSKKKSSKRSRGPASHYGDLPNIQMPNMSTIKNLGAVTPLPPPPPLLAAFGDEVEQQAISDMLLSWYMTGYHTGLYQGMKRAQQLQSKQSRRY